MGVALFIVPEREVEGLDTFVDGKALAHVKDLDGLAHQAGVRPLMEFFSMGPGDYLGILGEEGDDGELHLPAGMEPPVETWFDAESGLDTVRGLLRHLADRPGAFVEAERAAEDRGEFKGVFAGRSRRRGISVDRVVEDLREFEAVLSGLAREGVRWHLSVDV